jgi:hypothetical protein
MAGLLLGEGGFQLQGLVIARPGSVRRHNPNAAADEETH